MCRGSKFQVYVSLDDLERSSHEREYLQLLGRIDGSGDKADDEAYDSLCRWITAPCSELFQELAPSASIPTNLTLQVFYYPPTYVLKLLVKEGALHVEHLPDELPESPAVLMLPAQNVPSQPQVPRLSAADLRIVPIGKPSEDIACDIPQRVCTAEGVVMFFKPGFHKSQFVREGKIQAKISDAGLRGKLRVSNLRGIVLSEDTTMIIGSVFDLIPSLAPNLESREYLQAQQHHGKWERQVQDIIERLHAHDIVWGDVHPGNIVIDTTLDAWAVDFGGGCVEEFVDREKSETEEVLTDLF
ncbi:MAG: Glucosamine-phosphate N-acetyltransferase-like protein [Chaenotheca gracillima]|nr:MAG: Glucosamine-phosphate N-acetyltransferase-like protein [Chaenotheca gracillima]